MYFDHLFYVWFEQVWSLRWLKMQLWVNDKYKIAKISQRAERGGCQTIAWQIYFIRQRRGDAEMEPDLTMGKYQITTLRLWWTMTALSADCDWDGLWFSTGSGGKQLKAEIISKTIRTRDCGQMVTVKQADRNSEYSVSRICLLFCWSFKSMLICDWTLITMIQRNLCMWLWIAITYKKNWRHAKKSIGSNYQAHSFMGKKSLKKGRAVPKNWKIYTNKIHSKVCYKKRRQIQISKFICIEYICD